jgi:hypothetical protein
VCVCVCVRARVCGNGRTGSHSRIHAHLVQRSPHSSHHPLLTLARMRFAPKVLLTNEAAMLTNVCKLLFAETRIEGNDGVVHEESIASILVAVLRLAQWVDGDYVSQEECVLLNHSAFRRCSGVLCVVQLCTRLGQFSVLSSHSIFSDAHTFTVHSARTAFCCAVNCTSLIWTVHMNTQVHICARVLLRCHQKRLDEPRGSSRVCRCRHDPGACRCCASHRHISSEVADCR